MATDQGTRCRKICVAPDTLYVFKVHKETPLVAEDIIKAGILVAVKVGEMAYVDARGKHMGKSVGGINRSEIVVTVPDTLEIRQLIQAAHTRTVARLDAEEKNPGLKLRRLLFPTWNGKTIERDDSVPRYFVRSTKPCANCTEDIVGTQTVHINVNGKVSKVDPFVADDPEVTLANEGSTKMLHAKCSIKRLKIPESPEHVNCGCNFTPLTREQIEQAERRTKREPEEPTRYEEAENELIKILQNQGTYSAEFARGAALMYLLLKGTTSGDY